MLLSFLVVGESYAGEDVWEEYRKQITTYMERHQRAIDDILKVTTCEHQNYVIQVLKLINSPHDQEERSQEEALKELSSQHLQRHLVCFRHWIREAAGVREELVNLLEMQKKDLEESRKQERVAMREWGIAGFLKAKEEGRLNEDAYHFLETTAFSLNFNHFFRDEERILFDITQEDMACLTSAGLDYNHIDDIRQRLGWEAQNLYHHVERGYRIRQALPHNGENRQEQNP